MKNPKAASFFIITLLSLLAGCGLSLKDAQDLGFSNVKEMKELNTRGYATKDEYIDAAYRDPAFCSYGAYRINPPADGNEDGIYSIDESIRYRWIESQCIGKRVVWIVQKDSLSTYPRAVGQIEAIRFRSPSHWIAPSKVVGKTLRSDYTRDESIGYPERFDYFFDIEDTIRDAEGNVLFQFDAIADGFYLIDGTTKSWNQVTAGLTRFEIQAISISAVRPVENSHVVSLLRELSTVSSAKTVDAIAKGFPSYEHYLHAEMLGMRSYQDFLGAHQSALKKLFQSIWEQRTAEQKGFFDGPTYKKALAEEAYAVALEEKRKRLEPECLALSTAKLNCSTAGDYSLCMSIQFKGHPVAQEYLCRAAGLL
jgi:hypothetical protein